jgi:hypothetical protein
MSVYQRRQKYLPLVIRESRNYDGSSFAMDLKKPVSVSHKNIYSELVLQPDPPFHKQLDNKLLTSRLRPSKPTKTALLFMRKKRFALCFYQF